MILARRGALRLAGVFATLSIAPASAAEPVIVRLRSDPDGSHVGFDPIGLLIQPVGPCALSVRRTTIRRAAYHPANANHSLRIPTTARPWSSDVLQPGEHFEVTLTVPGVYDYFCAPHEEAGMVGRLIVGQPIGPGSLPFDWFKGRPEARDWLPVPATARATFPSIDDIMRRGTVPDKLLGMAH